MDRCLKLSPKDEGPNGPHEPIGESDVSNIKSFTEAEVRGLQDQWANAILSISKAYKENGDYVKEASDAAAQLYGYGHFKVLFKPTKVAEHPFRPTGGGALSYFVGGKAAGKGGYSEDAGFAHNGGKGWSAVRFENHDIDLNGPVAFAMGHYYFTCATTGIVTKVEYTFGYKRTADGEARIFVHHSSIPYKTSPASRQLRLIGEWDLPNIKSFTEAEVRGLQGQWANAILSISKAYKENGDYVKEASDAAAQLYGYGHFKVLFKPTKVAEHPFRPTGGGALSYFVGGKAAGKGGYSEDAGFAHNGGKGWSAVRFENHDIDLNGPVAFAMGHYYFTCATTGIVTKVEYTFGYKRTADGEARIFVHHSSIPYKTSPASRQLRLRRG